MVKVTLLGLLIASVYAANSDANPIIGNASFEAPVVGAAGYAADPTGASWTFSGLSGVSARGSYFFTTPAPDGNQAAYFQAQNGSTASLSQTISNFVPGSSYTLSFYLSAREGISDSNPYTPTPIDVQLNGIDLGTYTPASAAFQLFTLQTFVATSTSQLLSFTATGSANGTYDFDTNLDDVSIVSSVPDVSSVPEPASLLLFVASIFVGLGMRRLSKEYL